MGADWLLPIYGLIVGMLVGLTGMGGGVLMTPLLVLGLGMPATAAIGTDLDGGYGIEQTPNHLDTIADVQKIPDLLWRRGYGEEEVAAVMHGNWLRLLERGLPTG